MPDPAPAVAPTFTVARVDGALRNVLGAARADLAALDPRTVLLVDEVERLVAAGGKRLRPAFCYWGYRAAGGPDGEPIIRVAAALELLHTMALIHDDLMDGATERRGVAASAPRLASEVRSPGVDVDPERFGTSVALLVGDLAAVLADRCLLGSGFPPEALVNALAPYHRMRTEMAAGQFLDVAGLADDPALVGRVAALKGGSYTVEGPLVIGATLAGAGPEVHATLQGFGAPLGEAFQLRDDLQDGEGPPGITAAEVNALVARARAALDPSVLPPEAMAALDALAGRVAMA